MFKYVVTVEAETENAFWMVELGEDGYTEFENFDAGGNEVHAVYSEHRIDNQLDRKENIISYTVEDLDDEDESEPHPTNEEIDEELRQLADDTVYSDWPETEQEANHL